MTSTTKPSLETIKARITRLVAIVAIGVIVLLAVLALFEYDRKLDAQKLNAYLLSRMDASHEARAVVDELILVQDQILRHSSSDALADNDLERRFVGLVDRLLTIAPAVYAADQDLENSEWTGTDEAVRSNLESQFSQLELTARTGGALSVSDVPLTSLQRTLDQQRRMLSIHFSAETKAQASSWNRTARIAGPIALALLTVGLLTYFGLFRRLELGLELDASVRQELATQEAWFRALFDTSPVAVGVFRDGAILNVNPAYLALFGYEPGFDVAGKSMEAHIAPESRSDIRDFMKGSSREDEKYRSIEIDAVRTDGSLFSVEATVGRITLPDGPAFVAFFTDLTARKQAEAAHHESDRRFELMFSGTSDMLLLMSVQADGSLVFDVMNKAYEDYIRETYPSTGVDPIGRDREVVLASWGIPEDAIKVGSLMYDAVVSEREAKHFEVTIPLAGNERYLDVSVEPILNVACECTHVLWSGRDITQRRRADEEIQRLAAIVKHSSDFIGIADIEGHALFLNDSGRDLVGISDDEQFYETKVPDYFPDSEQETLANDIMPQLMESGRWAGEINFQHFQTGELVPVWFDIFRIDDPVTGEPINFATVTRDIRERKEQQEELRRLNESLEHMVEERTAELRQSEEQFRAINEASPTGIAVTDPEGAILFGNDAYVRVLGIPLEECLKFGWAEAIHPDDRERTREAWLAYTRDPSRNFADRTRLLHKDGTAVWIAVTAAPIYAGDEISGHVVMVVDETEEHFAKEDLRRAKEDAEEANAAKDRFLSRVSHELRTPLNAILGFAQVMSMDRLSTNHEASIKHILDAGDHLLSLVEELLDIARIEAGELEMRIEAVDARQQVLECVELLSPLAKASQVTITIAGSSDAVVPIKADPKRMTQIIFNVLSNAIKFNKQKGSVTISFEAVDQDRIAVVIKDTGSGISQDKLARVFEPFDRLGAEGTHVKGTGIGLTVSASLAEAMDATIEIASTEGVGTFVTITFQAVGKLVIDDDLLAIVEPLTEGDGSKLKVLLVEDNRSNYLLIETVFQRRGFCDLRLAKTAEEGLRMAKQFKPDLFLLDVNLPDSLGTELIEKILAQKSLRNTPIVIVSADASSATVKAFMEKGAYAYLTKPIDVAQLLQLIDEIAVGVVGRTS